MISLEIKYSPEYEKHRLKETLEELTWFRENGYNVLYPQGLSEESKDEEIKAAVLKEYKKEEYDDYADTLHELWGNYLLAIEQSRPRLPFDLKEKYTIVLTRYGTNGSYFPAESKIIINRITRNKDTVLGTLIHEIVHIGVEYLVEKYKISHWKKERFVDLICNKHFSEVRKMQNITKEDVSQVDIIFEDKYPDTESIAKAIGQTM